MMYLLSLFTTLHYLHSLSYGSFFYF